MSSSERGLRRGCSQHGKQCLGLNKFRVHCESCPIVPYLVVVSLSGDWKSPVKTGFPMEAGWATPKVSDMVQAAVREKHRPVGRVLLPSRSPGTLLVCQNTTVWSKDQKGKREHCSEKVSYCAKTHFSTDDCKRLLKPCLSWLVNPWFGSIQREYPDFMTKIKPKDLRKCTNIHS